MDSSQRKLPPSIQDLLPKEPSKPVFISKKDRQQAPPADINGELDNHAAKYLSVQMLMPQDQTSQTTDKQLPSISNRSVVKKPVKPASRFQFDWDAEDDTSALNEDLLSVPMRSSSKPSSNSKSKFMDVDPAPSMNDGLSRPTAKKHKSTAITARYDGYNWRDKPYEAMMKRDWRIMREELEIAVRGSGANILPPIRHWSESPLHYRLKDLIRSVGYHDPTPIQRQTIPIALRNRDVIGIAETGSGKTAAFLIPMFEFLLKLPKLNADTVYDGPYALIMVPTRELAQQIEREALKFCKQLEMHCVSLVGGHGIAEQSFNLRNGAEIIIGTPGRLRDLLEKRIVVFNQCTYIVMDEADRMVVDMGFEQDLNDILAALPVSNEKPDSEDAEDEIKMFTVDGKPKYRQTTMFSATMPTAVERLAKAYMRRPVVVTVGDAGAAAASVKQQIDVVKETTKFNRLLSILESEKYEPPMIVFVNQKRNVDVVAGRLDKAGFNVATLHGGKSQESREHALKQVKLGQKDILVATDVAGRGIDIKNVSLVINYDMPQSIEDYTHRIGRTGRAGKSGMAISLLTMEDTHIFFDLKQMLVKTNNRVPDELAQHEASQARQPSATSGKRKQLPE